MGTLNLTERCDFCSYMWMSHKASGRVIIKFCCVGYAALMAERILWPCGLSALKISVIIWKNDATVWAQIILLCFKTIHSRYFPTQNNVLWNLFKKERCDKQDTTELHNV